MSTRQRNLTRYENELNKEIGLTKEKQVVYNERPGF